MAWQDCCRFISKKFSTNIDIAIQSRCILWETKLIKHYRLYEPLHALLHAVCLDLSILKHCTDQPTDKHTFSIHAKAGEQNYLGKPSINKKSKSWDIVPTSADPPPPRNLGRLNCFYFYCLFGFYRLWNTYCMLWGTSNLSPFHSTTPSSLQLFYVHLQFLPLYSRSSWSFDQCYIINLRFTITIQWLVDGVGVV